MRWAFCLVIGISAACDGPGGGGGPLPGGTPVTIGPVLNFPSTNVITCADGIIIQANPQFPQPAAFQGAQSCLYLNISAGEIANQPVLQPSAPGRVTSATIRVGQSTGPMRFVKMRIIHQHGFGAACCSVEQYGDVFTPAPNTDTTVPLAFDIVFERVPPPTDTTTVTAQEYVALEVLAPNVPIPGIWRQNGGPEQFLNTEVWLPALSQQGVPAPSQNLRSTGSFSGFLAAFNYTFVPR